MKNLSTWIFAISLTQGVSVLAAGPIESHALPSRSKAAGALFELVPPRDSGVDLIHQFPSNAPLSLLQEQGAGGGICAGDIDGDGLPEIFVTNYDQGCRLYRNLGDWKFADVSESCGVRASGRWCMGATFVDIDNDGDLDLYVCCFNSANLLFINDGHGRFVERAHDFGLDWTGASVMAAFGDYDRDGMLDLYLLTNRDNASPDHRLPSSARNASERRLVRLGPDGRPQVAKPFEDLFALLEKGGGRVELAIAGQSDQLFHQEKNGAFRNVTVASGIQGHDIGLGVSWWDYDSDGWPDVYVANDHKTPDRLWRNNHDGTFTDVAPMVLPTVPLASMGTDVADVNNDGFFDLLATEMAGTTHSRRMMIHQDFQKNEWFHVAARPGQQPRNALFLGTGTSNVFECARLSGLEATDWTWSPKFGDFDNDGWVDLFISNGMSRDYVNADLIDKLAKAGPGGWVRESVLKEKNLAYRNLGSLQFERVEEAWGLGHVSASFGACVADLDRDGNLDLVVMNFGEVVSLYRNRETSGHRATFRLNGFRSNRQGVGAVVQAWTSSGLQSRTLQLTSGYLSSNEPIIHFGTGRDEKIRKVTIRWPSGIEQSFEDLSSDRAYTVWEPEVAAVLPKEQVRTSLFHPGQPISDAVLPGGSNRDVSVQPLLPWKLSRLGPGLAVGDIDGDGREDFFIGGVGGESGSLFLQDAVGRFRKVSSPALERDREREDMGALLFDADGDGDLDLFVVSGSYDVDPESPLLQDRLYLNDGKGRFETAPPALLPMDRIAGSVVCAADYDRDGDLDLFVGGRLVPGRYPQIPESRLLRNDRGKFTDVTAASTSGLLHGGMVTSAVWVDVNNDGWPDLVTANEWGPLKLFLNQGGRLVQDEGGELFRHTGLWQGVVAADFDGDGNLDLAASNLGLNTFYRATPESPVSIRLLKLGDEGRDAILETFFDHGIWRPLRRRESLATSWPTLLSAYPTHESFTRADLSFFQRDAGQLSGAVFEITSLESALWINDGRGHFQRRPLPPLAQIAPSFGILAGDFDGDGMQDLALTQNNLGVAMEYGTMTGGLGLILTGRTNNAHMEPVMPGESQFVLPGEGRSLASIERPAGGAPGLLAVQKDGKACSFENRKRPGARWLVVTLKGGAWNPSGVGARVDVEFDGGIRRVAEVQAGSGYMSQSGSRLYFGVPPGAGGVYARVRWPDGVVTYHASQNSSGSLVCERRRGESGR